MTNGERNRLSSGNINQSVHCPINGTIEIIIFEIYKIIYSDTTNCIIATRKE